MSHAHRDDADLLAHARQGDAAAFAVLLHRHGPAVHAASSDGTTERVHEDTGEPPVATAAVTRTFLAAMRQLDQADDQDLRGWLLRLALGADPDPAALTRARRPEPLPGTVLDQVWGELAERWPTGRRPLRAPRWLAHAALLIVLLALAAGVPYVVLVTASDREEAPPPTSEVVAEPLEGGDRAAATATDRDTASPNDGDLPDDLDQE